MKTSTHLGVSAAPSALRYRACASGLLLLCVLFLSVSSASALPRATLGNCNPDYVNNPGALKCINQGIVDDEVGLANAHYLACTSDGTLFCCVNNAQGGQDCIAIDDATLGTRGILGDLQLEATIGGQQATSTGLSQIQQQLKDMKTEMDNLQTLLQTQCSQQPPPVQ